MHFSENSTLSCDEVGKLCTFFFLLVDKFVFFWAVGTKMRWLSNRIRCYFHGFSSQSAHSFSCIHHTSSPFRLTSIFPIRWLMPLLGVAIYSRGNGFKILATGRCTEKNAASTATHGTAWRTRGRTWICWTLGDGFRRTVSSHELTRACFWGWWGTRTLALLAIRSMRIFWCLLSASLGKRMKGLESGRGRERGGELISPSSMSLWLIIGLFCFPSTSKLWSLDAIFFYHFFVWLLMIFQVSCDFF